MAPEDAMTLREYLMRALINQGLHWTRVHEVVEDTIAAHPELDPRERRTWDEWQRLIPE